MTGEPVRVCAEGDIAAGTARAFMVGSSWIGVFHTSAGWYAIGNSCPHQGISLAEGHVDDTSVTCYAHDRCYDLATGQGPGVNEIVPCYPVEVRGGEVFVTPVRRNR